MEMKKQIAVGWVAVLMLTFSRCKDKTSDPILNDECARGNILINVKERSGTIYYNSLEKKYAVHTSEQGTYDSQDIGFLCNPPDSIKIDGLAVNFDGDYYAYEKDRVAPIGGATYYYLHITKLKKD